ARALDALGGHGLPAASCVWHVVGMQTSIREWALRQGWGGRPVRQENAQGILVAALGVLAKHYGMMNRCAQLQRSARAIGLRVASIACKQNARAIRFSVDA
ncbi:MAG: hypothetical protein ACXW14_10980, partial [Burkholderiaceae bacterium]